MDTFPRSGKDLKISRDGGVLPRWRYDSRELFFLALDGQMMAATLDVEGRPVTQPRALFATPLRPGHNRAYDVTRDGERFLLPISEPGAPLTVVLNGSLPSGRCTAASAVPNGWTAAKFIAWKRS